MLKNYLKVAWRNLLRNRTFSLINIAGLAVGLCCFLLIALYVTDELSYDRYNEKADRIYRINTDARMGGVDMYMAETPDPMGALMKKDFPEVEAFTRIYGNRGSKLVRKDGEFITEANIAYVDSTFFEIFTLPAIAGNTATALDEPNTVVLTASAARKYFHSVNATGRTLEVQEQGRVTPYRVTAVIADIPENSHFKFDMLFSMDNLDYQWGQVGNHNFYTYLLLHPGANEKSFGPKLEQYVMKHLMPHIMQEMHIKTPEEFERAGNRVRYSLLPLTRIHLYSDRQEEIRPQGSIQYVYIFSAVALFILLLACINFMNLNTARSAGRAKEVGIRKTLGTRRQELVMQFLTESTLMALLSFCIALGLAALLLPAFNDIAGKSLRLQTLFSPLLLVLLPALPLVTGLLAGSYPAFFLSAFRPVEVLKGRLRLGGNSTGIRSVLVVFQFATSIVLIIATLVVYRQLHFIQHRNMGFNREQVLIINGSNALGSHGEAFKHDVLQLPGVSSGTLSSFLPVANAARSNMTVSKLRHTDARNSFNMQNWYVDHDYLPTLGMQLLKGRNFSKDYGGDANAVIINETTARLLGYDDPVGKQLYRWDGTPLTIIGLVRNFNYENLRQRIGPLGFFLNKGGELAAFKVNTADINGLIGRIRDKWKAMAPGMPFSYRFMDESFDAMYRAELRVGKLAVIFAGLAVFIACLGIFGLSIFIAEQRMKEIGVRKVLGASVQGIVQLLSGDFLKLVTIAFIIAAPLAWWIMHRWLQDFVYRVQISWWVFAAAGAGALLLALITVSFQSVKAAVANPVKSLNN